MSGFINNDGSSCGSSTESSIEVVVLKVVLGVIIVDNILKPETSY